MKKRIFSKNNSLALKGIAIIFMMFHHNFIPGRFADPIYDVSFWPLIADRVVRISLFFKICVSIFAFITGYGLMLSYKKISDTEKQNGKSIEKWIIQRLIKTLSGYWIIVALSLIICQIIDGRTFEIFFQNKNIYVGILEIILNFSGLGYILHIDLLNGTWWYMSNAVLFIVSIPLLYRLIKKHGYIITSIVLIAIPRILSLHLSTESYIAFIFAVFLGMICADKDLIVRVANFGISEKHKRISKIIKFIIETSIIILLYKVYYYIPISKYWEISFALIPMFIIFYSYEFVVEIPILKNVLEFLGKHSMNIFLVHTFIRAIYLEDFILKGKNFMIITLMVLLLSLVISILIEFFKKIIKYEKFINYIQNKISNSLKLTIN